MYSSPAFDSRGAIHAPSAKVAFLSQSEKPVDPVDALVVILLTVVLFVVGNLFLVEKLGRKHVLPKDLLGVNG